MADRTATDLFGSFEALRADVPAADAVVDVDQGSTLSRDQLARLVDAVDGPVRSAAVRNRIVAVQAANCPELIAAVLAAWRAGLVPLPIDRERSLGDIETLAQSLGIEVVLRGAELEEHRVGSGGEPVALASDVALLKLTSGSTGEPRAVAVRAGALEVGIDQICSTMGIGTGDRNLATLPLAHSYGFDNVLGTLVRLGSPAVLVSDLVPRRLLTVIRETEVTVWPAVPLLLDVLTRSAASAEASLAALRLIVSAGAPLPRGTREAFHSRFGIRPRTFYGATECGGIAFDREGDEDVPDGCVGQPLDGVGVELEDLEDGVGRIRVRSRAVAAATLPTPTPELEEGTLLASDLGRLDGQGRLHLLGRVGDFVKIHGHKVHPIEVERVIRAIPGVTDAVVLPYARSDVSEGLRAVVAAPGLERPEIARACERSLPTYKVPRSIEIRDELPRNERGKLDRRKI